MKCSMRFLLLAMLMYFCVGHSVAQTGLTDDIDSQSESIADVMNYFPMTNGVGTAGQPTPAVPTPLVIGK